MAGIKNNQERWSTKDTWVKQYFSTTRMRTGAGTWKPFYHNLERFKIKN